MGIRGGAAAGALHGKSLSINTDGVLIGFTRPRKYLMNTRRRYYAIVLHILDYSAVILFPTLQHQE